MPHKAADGDRVGEKKRDDAEGIDGVQRTEDPMLMSESSVLITTETKMELTGIFHPGETATAIQRKASHRHGQKTRVVGKLWLLR